MHKKVRCHKNGIPYRSHSDEDAAEDELIGLCQKCKRIDFEVFKCDFCKKFHVRRKNVES